MPIMSFNGDTIHIPVNGPECQLDPRHPGVVDSLPDGKINTVTVVNLNRRYKAYYVIGRGGDTIAKGELAAAGESGDARTVPVPGGRDLKVANLTTAAEPVVIGVVVTSF
ncbi:hypothetical protein [Polyangium sorediatum]|uniref:Uncharacterized protein n=1 Tax=Polyangium sorediatum TaxID=889274 RepID=A0ABT6PA54_9BACT|nr:hypothetical protein [Polyangium sorediatum]MDI1437446.1 hypothetical protein [Polyangium sorediatum]